jgi:hypothetical protein
MASIWAITWRCGEGNGGCDSHYTTEEKALAALAQLRSNVVAQALKLANQTLSEVKMGNSPWWAAAEYGTGPIDEFWVERYVKETAQRFDSEHEVEEQMLDPPVPKLDGA